MNQQDLETRIRGAADQCVKCGLCLPHCPTYRLRQDEGESPRGRIALAQGLVDKQFPPSWRLDTHLSSCLECRACEPVCPSLVAVGSVMDDTRALRRNASKLGRFWTAAWLDALSSGPGTRAAALVARVYASSGLGRLMEWSGLLGSSRLAAYHRVALQLKKPARLAANGQQTPLAGREIGLFVGCVARAAQPGALTAARDLLTRLGFHVGLPPTQGCCGALHRHNGFPDRADRLLAINASAFADRPAVGVASACVAELRTHPALAATQELCRFLAALEWPDEVTLRPLAKMVAVHEPCSHRNILRDAAAAYDLLGRIPEISLLGLEDNPFCCGAAGSYLLQHPQTARALAEPKLRQLRETGAEILVTTNTGCALHLAAGAREAGLRLEVLHPVELVLRQIET